MDGGGIAIVDRDERPLLYAVAVEQVDEPTLSEVCDTLTARGHRPPLLLLADPEIIRFYRPDGSSPVELPTSALVDHYHTESMPWQLSPPLLLTYLEAWFSDLAYGWGDTEPPGIAACRQAGLMEALERDPMHVIPDVDGSLRP